MIEFSTTQYEFAHGKKPRGYGRWVFFFDGETSIEKSLWHTGKFSEVKALAIRWAVIKGHHKVTVGS